jgi:para-nitrobenzyl esterase
MAPLVDTTWGRISGIEPEMGVHAFKGIPYAASTAGPNRFLPPKPPPTWTGVREATEFASACPPAPMPEMLELMPSNELAAAFDAYDEDCLSLNVWTPSLTGSRPVMVWFHGGAWSGGSGADMDGSRLARRDDVVVVAVTHRLHFFGFLHLGDRFGDELSSAGHLGMLDLAAALAWVRDNVAAFGGDPQRVTVFGQSGGGAKVATALAMPYFDGLFHRAIVQSGHDLWRRMTPDVADRSTAALLDELGIRDGDVEHLQRVSPSQLLAAYLTVSPALRAPQAGERRGWVHYDLFAPVSGTELLPTHPSDGLADWQRGVDVIVGTEQFDHWNMTALAGSVIGYPDDVGRTTIEDVRRHLRPILDDRTDEVVDAYRTSRPGMAPSTLLALVVTDCEWRIPAVSLVEARLDGVPDRPTYMYLNEGPVPIVSLNFDAELIPGYWIGVGRGLLEQIPPAWRNFAGGGDPQHDRLPRWDPYEQERRTTMVFGNESKAVDDPYANERAVWTRP